VRIINGDGGINPLIDAVCAALGQTGSNSTIHHYLCELAAEEGQSFGAQVAVSEALQDLVARLAEPLHQEAEGRSLNQTLLSMQTEQTQTCQ